MKFWQFISLCKELNINLSSINLDAKWDMYITWSCEFDIIVDKQDRSKLDFLVPNELSLQVFSTSKSIFYLSDGYLRKRALNDGDIKMVVLDILNTYGGEKLEEMLEYGLVKV